MTDVRLIDANSVCKKIAESIHDAEEWIGVYHEKNYKRHRRVRRKHLDRVKQVDQSWVVRYI